MKVELAPQLELLTQCHPLALLPAALRDSARQRYFTDVLLPTASSAQDGVYSYQALPWDTAQLGLACARIDFLTGDVAAGLHACVKRARSEHVRYLTCRVDAADQSCIELLAASGFGLVDGLLSFARSLDNSVDSAAACRMAGDSDIGRLREIAGGVFQHSRFHADPAIADERAHALHAQWAENAVRGQAADFVMVYEAEGRVLGFCTGTADASYQPYLGSPLGVIGLVAVASEARGRGIATALTRAVSAEFVRRGVGHAMVGTQMRNLAAARTYEGCGFRLLASSLTWRILLS